MAILLRTAGVTFVADAYSSVHHYVAAAVKAAGIEGARVNALLIEAGPVVRALGILSALWNRFCKCN